MRIPAAGALVVAALSLHPAPASPLTGARDQVAGELIAVLPDGPPRSTSLLRTFVEAMRGSVLATDGATGVGPAPGRAATGSAATANGALVGTARADTAPADTARWADATALLQRTMPDFERWHARPEALRLQVLITVLERDGTSYRVVERYAYRRGAEYLYPASAIKLVAAAAALELLEERLPGVALDDLLAARLVTEHGTTTLAETLRRCLVVSSNRAFNALYDLVGHEELNRRAWEAGLGSVRFHHRLSEPAEPAVHRRSGAVTLRGRRGATLELPERSSALAVPPHTEGDVAIGVGWIDDRTRQRVDGPMDFGTRNGASLEDLQALVLTLMGAAPPDGVRGFRLSAGAVAHLRALMLEIPEGPGGPGFERAAHRFKPALPALERAIGLDALRYANKAGRAYGFHIENAWIEDRTSGRVVALAAGLVANEDGVFNNDRYEYETVSFPVMQALGVAVSRLLRPQR